MSMVHTWTLWQRMPSRYQLTTHAYNMDTDECMVVGNATDSSKNNVSLRPASSGRHSSLPNSRSQSYRNNIMLSSYIVDPALSVVASTRNQHTSKNFPRRNSDYVSTFQKQRRVNSARRRLAEMAPTPNVPGKQQSTAIVMTLRAQTVPTPPVTISDSNKEQLLKQSESSPPEDKALHINMSIKSKLISEPSKVNLIHNTKSLSSTTSPVHRSHDTDPKLKPKTYIVKDTNNATVYIDRGKVMYFRKSRHDMTPLLNTQSSRAHRNTCFLAEIRRDYLKHPKYERDQSSTRRKTENDPNRIANERVDYNKRVEHILNYYDENVNNPHNPRPRPASGYRTRSPKGAHVNGLSLPHTSSSRPPSRAASASPDPAECSNDFMRLSRQLKLHKRQLCIHTPGVQHGNNVADIDMCRCSMCRMELQLALVTRTISAGVSASTDVIEGETPKEDNHPDNDISNIAGDKANIYMDNSNTLEVERITYNVNNNAHVSFQNPDVNLVARAQETRFISCKLPEVDALTASESVFESARSNEVLSMCRDDIRPKP